jgi:nitrate reductase gamma subunit
MSLAFLYQVFFAFLPYVALFTFFLVTIQRYRVQRFTYSSLSSQFLENRDHFWGLVPFHYGILTVLAGHILFFLIPKQVLWWNSVPLRLYVLETFMLVAGLLSIVGLGNAMVRRITISKIRRVTNKADWILFALLMFQFVSGVLVALFNPWGSSWFSAAMAPYLWSIATLSPNLNLVSGLPWLVQLHIVNAWLVIGFFPFTRLVHVLVVPNPYLWRKPQVVRWNWDRTKIRTAE